jgi:butyrate kinase
MPHRLLIINPGGTSTKVAIFQDQTPQFVEVIRHPENQLRSFQRAIDQEAFRRDVILNFLEEKGVELERLSAVVGRGGALKPLKSGTYQVVPQMLADIRKGYVFADHPSNLGALLAHDLASKAGISAYVVDPVSVDEFIPEARISGLPELKRKSLSHVLNLKMVCRQAAASLNKRYEEINLVAAHLGSGISVSAHRHGQMVDVNNANDGGPFAPTRAGGLPATGLVKLCYSGKFSQAQLMDRLTKRGGLLAYLKTDDAQEVERRIREGDQQAKLIYEAMIYQIAKEIGAMAAALKGHVDAVVLTGGLAHSTYLVNSLRERVSFIAPVLVFPGEDEMRALALGALRVLTGQEKPMDYAKA